MKITNRKLADLFIIFLTVSCFTVAYLQITIIINQRIYPTDDEVPIRQFPPITTRYARLPATSHSTPVWTATHNRPSSGFSTPIPTQTNLPLADLAQIEFAH